jgi:plasmid stabilization system protein ParE
MFAWPASSSLAILRRPPGSSLKRRYVRAGLWANSRNEGGVPELGEPTLREIFISRYRLIYEILEDRVAVLRIIHGSRDLLAAWGRRGSQQ